MVEFYRVSAVEYLLVGFECVEQLNAAWRGYLR
jgi:hypothetical protein